MKLQNKYGSIRAAQAHVNYAIYNKHYIRMKNYIRGILYGVGIGPGDSDLLTIKAIKILNDADVIVFPGEVPEKTIAWSIIKPVVELEGKELVGIPFPMTKDRMVLDESHRNGAEIIKQYLDRGLNAAFPTLGDPSVYSTFTYVNKILKKDGYDTKVIPGIPSFCAAAAKINEPLGEEHEQIHIIPSSYGIDEALELQGTKVLMKAGRKIGQVIDDVNKRGLKMILAENLGMTDEKIILDPSPDITAGYYTLIIVKDSQEVR